MKLFLLNKARLIKIFFIKTWQGEYPLYMAVLYFYLATRFFIISLLGVFIWGQWFSPQTTFITFFNILLIHTIWSWFILAKCAKNSTKISLWMIRGLITTEFLILGYISNV